MGVLIDKSKIHKRHLLDCFMIISHQHQFIFLKTQKTAGTSVELALSNLCGPSDVIPPVSEIYKGLGCFKAPQNYEILKQFQPRLASFYHFLGFSKKVAGLTFHEHISAADLRARMNPDIFDSYKKVTIVRNAWDREVSLYFWATRNLKNVPKFNEFACRHVRDPDRKTFKIYSIDGKVVADTILRYENIAADYAAFVSSLGVADVSSLPNAKGSFRKVGRQDYRSLYDKRSIEAVRNRQRREIEYFNMTFD